MDWLTVLQEIASYLPTGLNDPNAYQKLLHEQEEMLEMLREGDSLGAILEAADVMYYAAKCVYTGALSFEEACKIVLGAAISVGRDAQTVFAVAEGKFSYRAIPGNPKCDATERNIARRAIGLEYMIS